MSNKRAIIGLGNILRRDDGIGIAVLASLLSHYKRPGLEYLDFGIASFDLIYRLEGFNEVLLIDGIRASLVPGELKIFPLGQARYTLQGPPISSHELNLQGLFQLSKKLKIKTKIYVAGIQVKDISYGDSLSGELKKNLKEITKEIAVFIDRRLLKNKACVL